MQRTGESRVFPRKFARSRRNRRPAIDRPQGLGKLRVDLRPKQENGATDPAGLLRWCYAGLGQGVRRPGSFLKIRLFRVSGGSNLGAAAPRPRPIQPPRGRWSPRVSAAPGRRPITKSELDQRLRELEDRLRAREEHLSSAIEELHTELAGVGSPSKQPPPNSPPEDPARDGQESASNGLASVCHSREVREFMQDLVRACSTGSTCEFTGLTIGKVTRDEYHQIVDRLKLRETVLFGKGGHTLSRDWQDRLDGFARELPKACQLFVIGRASHDGAPRKVNDRVAARRAAYVMKYVEADPSHQRSAHRITFSDEYFPLQPGDPEVAHLPPDSYGRDTHRLNQSATVFAYPCPFEPTPR